MMTFSTYPEGPPPRFTGQSLGRSPPFHESYDGESVPEGDLEELFDLDGDIFKSFDAGIALGAELGSGPFLVGARYTYGFLDINRNEEEDPSAPTIRNGVFSITSAFQFGR